MKNQGWFGATTTTSQTKSAERNPARIKTTSISARTTQGMTVKTPTQTMPRSTSISASTRSTMRPRNADALVPVNPRSTSTGSTTTSTTALAIRKEVK